jgi:hypothetical protein
METEFDEVLATEFQEYVDIHGNSLYPIKTKDQWMLYNIYCFDAIKKEEELDQEQLGEGQIMQLLDFWDFTKKKMKEDNTYLCIVNNKGVYKLMPYYRDKIKMLHSIKGKPVDD